VSRDRSHPAVLRYDVKNRAAVHCDPTSIRIVHKAEWNRRTRRELEEIVGVKIDVLIELDDVRSSGNCLIRG
jgi:hypothetical protein